MNKTMKHFFLFTAGVMLALSNLSSQNIRVNANAGNDSLLIGAQMDFNIGITLEDGAGFYVNGPAETAGDHFEILDRQIDSSHMENNLLNVNYRYLITSFDSGTFTIPSYEIVVNTPSGRQSYFSDSLGITVYSPPVDTSAAIKDVKAVINTPLTFREILPWASGGLILVAIVAAVILLVRKMKGKEPVKLRKVIVAPPWEKALKALDRLKEEKIWQKGRVKEYYILLSNTVRQYVEDQFGVDAMESTTEETLTKFRHFAYDDGLLLEMLEGLLNLSDLVKFAKEDPTPSENEMNLNNAYIFIEKTKPADTGLRTNGEV